MPTCVAYGCSNRYSKKLSGLSYFKFPANVEQRRKWIIAVRRKDWLPSKYSFLCSNHFSEDQIDRTSLSSVRLRQNAVPNIFKGFSFNYEIKQELQKQSSQCINEEPLSDSSSSVNSSLLTKSQNEISDFSETDDSTVGENSTETKQLEWELEKAKATIVSYRKKIEALQQKNKQYKRKVDVLASILYEIKKYKCVTDDELETLLRACEPNKGVFVLVERTSQHESHSAGSSDEP